LARTLRRGAGVDSGDGRREPGLGGAQRPFLIHAYRCDGLGVYATADKGPFSYKTAHNGKGHDDFRHRRWPSPAWHNDASTQDGNTVI
jgi:hypothetical protein